MLSFKKLVLLCGTVILYSCFSMASNLSNQPVYQPKHSFSAPFYFAMGSSIPFWDYGGYAIATENFIRVVPAVQSRNGWIWNTLPNMDMTDFQINMEFSIHNQNSAIGADGLALWYTKESKKEGPLFGQAEDFTGVGILFDSYDNNQNGDTPAAVLVKNDGKKVIWDYENDFVANQIERCRADFRNLASGHVRVKIIYQHQSLQVYIDATGNNFENEANFQKCFIVDGIDLPKGNYFGITGMTGGLADNHDVFKFQVFDLSGMDGSNTAESTPNKSTEKPMEQAARNRGWYDPYTNTQEKPQVQNPEQQNTQSAPNQPAKPTDQAEKELFEKLKEKVKHLTKKKKKAAKQNKEQPIQTEANPVKTPQKIIEEEYSKSPEQEPQENEQQTGGKLNSLKTVTKQTLLKHQDHANQKMASILLKAIQEVFGQFENKFKILNDNLQQTHTTLSDMRLGESMTTMNDNFEAMNKHFNSKIERLKSDMTELSTQLKTETQTLKGELNRFFNYLSELNRDLQALNENQGSFSKSFSERFVKTSQDLERSVRKSTGIGFWTVFMIFQAIFVFVIYVLVLRKKKNGTYSFSKHV